MRTGQRFTRAVPLNSYRNAKVNAVRMCEVGRLNFSICNEAMILTRICSKVCRIRPRYQKNGKIFPTCGLTCAAKLQRPGSVEMCEVRQNFFTSFFSFFEIMLI